ncbi:MAG TPA: class I SAM-dependent methyltransferase [Longimicrobium sp.]|nr:class I SAM-dependent methyltransferase [Longimicrobium sp.]
MDVALNEQVRSYWELEPCGTSPDIVGGRAPLTREWFKQVEEHRYRVEPYIHAVAQFTRHHGQAILEVGVGAGTDHLQWARAGAVCHGVDLTEAAIRATRARLALYGFTSELQRVDAERLPFGDGRFDLVYSWGVIHHAGRPGDIIREIHRVLKPGGRFVGMLYGRHSLVALRVWMRHALLRGRPWRSLARVVGEHVESPGTRAYTVRELRALFDAFAEARVWPVLTEYDVRRVPRFVARWIPQELGWFLVVDARK